MLEEGELLLEAPNFNMTATVFKTFPLAEWAAKNKLPETAALNLANKEKVPLTSYQNVSYVEKTLMDNAFLTNFVSKKSKLQIVVMKLANKRLQIKEDLARL